MDNIYERFSNKYDVVESGCWIWKKPHKRRLYGKIRFNKIYTSAHRVSYIIFKGEIPNGHGS